MQITRQDIIEARRLQDQGWHDAQWHEATSTRKHTAIQYAISELGKGVSYKEIAYEAERFMEATKGQDK